MQTMAHTTNACISQSMTSATPSLGMRTKIVFVYKTFTASRVCNLTMMTNVGVCGASVMGGMFKLSATVSFATTMMYFTMQPHICQWTCNGGCGTVAITGSSNGLPVELMDFYIEKADDPQPDTEDNAVAKP